MFYPTYGSWLNAAKKYEYNGAEKQMFYQTYMSNSAHQREVNDLKAAGLNPVLSAGGSGASTPVGAYDETADQAAQAVGGMIRTANKSLALSAKMQQNNIKAMQKLSDNAIKSVGKASSDVSKSLGITLSKNLTGSGRNEFVDLLNIKPSSLKRAETGRGIAEAINNANSSDNKDKPSKLIDEVINNAIENSKHEKSSADTYDYNPEYDWYPSKRLVIAIGKMFGLDMNKILSTDLNAIKNTRGYQIMKNFYREVFGMQGLLDYSNPNRYSLK